MLFTDGLFEARERLKTAKSSSRRREMSMIFKQCNSASDVTDRITQQLSVFTDHENSLTDDVSVIVLRRREGVSEQAETESGGEAA
jgi:serine phosphatase RsbU (regulator of sigma subunit)